MAKRTGQRTPPRVEDDLPPYPDRLCDDADVTGGLVSGDYSGLELAHIHVVASRLERVLLTGTRFDDARLTDCVIVDSDLSGAFLEECRLTRAEFRGCRLSGLQAPDSVLDDVAFYDCKLTDSNFRRSVWSHAEFYRCDLAGSDFFGAKLPGSRFEDCDLGRVDLAKSDLRASRLYRVGLEGIRGGESLSGVTIGSELLIPAALAVFRALDISIDEEP